MKKQMSSLQPPDEPIDYKMYVMLLQFLRFARGKGGRTNFNHIVQPLDQTELRVCFSGLLVLQLSGPPTLTTGTS